MTTFEPTKHDWKALVPELCVRDIQRSLRFWCGLLGFRVLYDRPAERFAYLERGGVEIMLEEVGARSWLVAPLEAPFGRGMNLQIAVEDVQPLLDALGRAGWPLYREAEDRWYGAGAQEVGQRQFLVQDPDGYLLRFAQDLGVR